MYNLRSVLVYQRHRKSPPKDDNLHPIRNMEPALFHTLSAVSFSVDYGLVRDEKYMLIGALLEELVRRGYSYIESRQALGMPPDRKAALYGGASNIERQIRQQAQYEKYLRDGMEYQRAREAAGLGRDLVCWSDTSIVRQELRKSWVKEFLRQGHTMQEAESLASAQVHIHERKRALMRCQRTSNTQLRALVMNVTVSTGV